ncbi:uncharacterized protein LOC119350008 [Triticum dicoccoides]|uniref:uncharacterized protein LOC119350008 n=1 Tax=Triticum dicoccoides TaxID=85692 RepID=UPI00188F2B2B|nr:uncharacterized protein LOC119350008 [Triticum dicoccoides]
MARRYDSEWEEVKLINGYAMLMAYVSFACRGIGYLVFTWTTVVLLGGFVSNIDKDDFWRLTLITLVQILCISVSFGERMNSAIDLFLSLRAVKFLLTPNWQLADNSHGNNQVLVKRVIATVCEMVGRVVVLAHGVALYFCLNFLPLLMFFGLFIAVWISIRGLMEHSHYGDNPAERKNMDPAHTILYAMCVVEGAFFLYRNILLLSMRRVVKQVSQAYGFQDGDSAVSGYFFEISTGCSKNPSSVRGRNLVTYAVELLESSSPLSGNCLSGILILDRLLTRQHSDKIKSPNLIKQENGNQRHKLSDLEGNIGPSLVKMEKKEENKQERRQKKRRERKWWQLHHPRTEKEIIVQQRRVIKQLIECASSAHILQKLLHALDSSHSYDQKMREAAARIVEHVASGIRLEQFPYGIQCISSLINTIEEYQRLLPHQSSSKRHEASIATQPLSLITNNGQYQEQGRCGSSSDTCLSSSESESESEPESELPWESDLDTFVWLFSKTKKRNDNTDPFHGYKDLLLTGLRILWGLADSEDNCRIISNTEHLVCKIMAPVSYDLVHRTSHHSAWSTSVVEVSLRVMLRLVAMEGETGAKLCQQISSNKKAMTTIERIIKCEECKGRELQMDAIQILTQLCKEETESREDFIRMLVSIFVNGDSNYRSIKESAGKALALFLGSKNVAAIFPKANNDVSKFVGALIKIVSDQDEFDTCRKSAAEILEHLCIHYTGHDEYLGTLKSAMTGVMPKVLREILLGFGSTGEDGKPGYVRAGTGIANLNELDIRNGVIEVTASNNNENNTFSSRQNQHHKLHLVLMSLCVTACEKLQIDINAISPGERDQGDQGEGAAFRFAMKLVQLNRGHMTADSLTLMKLTTRLVIAAMKKHMVDGRSTIVKQDEMHSLMALLSRVSKPMLDLESCMVFTAGTRTKTIPDTAETLDSIIKLASELHGEIRDQDSEIVPASST